MGHVVDNPELNYVGNNRMAKCDFKLLIKEKYEANERVYTVPITCWGKSAEYAANNLTDNQLTLVEGKVRQDTWEYKEKQQSKTVIIASTTLAIYGKQKKEEPEPEEQEEIPF
jgi:single-stranded DNA-binding protein